MLIEGTINSATFSMPAAKKSALGPSAKYSSHPDESTTFTGGPARVPPPCRCPQGTRASLGPVAQGSTLSGPRNGSPEPSDRAGCRAIHELCAGSRPETSAKPSPSPYILLIDRHFVVRSLILQRFGLREE